MPTISDIHAQEILDSRGNPTVEAEITLDNGIKGRAAVPSGASTGTHEALELRDGDDNRFHGKGVLKAIANVHEKIKPALLGKDPVNQKEIDQTMIMLDGTPNKANLGANAILAVSLATARAAAASQNLPLYKYLAHVHSGSVLPLTHRECTPMFNVINGGLHGGGNIDFQEFMIIPDPIKSYEEKLIIGAELYQGLKKLLHKKGLPTAVGDEGGFAPSLPTNRDAIVFLKQLIEESGYAYAKDVFIGLDIASSTFFKDSAYHIKERPQPMTSFEYLQYVKALREEFSLFSIEDAFAEDEWETWAAFTSGQDSHTKIVGDDLLVTNKQRLETAIQKKACNAILVKVNQIGSLSETLEVIQKAREAQFTVIISHRSGETTDDFISDLAVGVGADMLKSGAPARGERVGKYNRLLQIYRELSK